MRVAGILLPVQCIPYDESPGGLRKACLDTVDTLSRSGIGIWQILPLNPPDFVGSPYASPSAFALDPNIVNSMAGDFPEPTSEELETWESQNQWAESWAAYRVLKSRNQSSWTEWGEWRNPSKLELRRLIKENIDLYKSELCVQWKLDKSIEMIRSYAEKSGILLMGDIPLYVAYDSADVWQNKELFNVSPEGEILECSGAPPDSFNKSGQFWGNPTYDWEMHEISDFSWWKSRITVASKRTPGIRLDHFIGLAEYWAIPPDANDASEGRWINGPGSKFMDAIIGISEFLVAEDLGMVGDSAKNLREKYGLHGMAILQFGWDSEYPPHHLDHIPKDVVAYTGTHDNDTFLGWYSAASPETKMEVKRRLRCKSSEVTKVAIKELINSNADVVIIPIQDLLGLGSSARINTPGTVTKDNWSWTAPDDWIIDPSWVWMYELVKSSGRTGWFNEF